MKRACGRACHARVLCCLFISAVSVISEMCKARHEVQSCSCVAVFLHVPQMLLHIFQECTMWQRIFEMLQIVNGIAKRVVCSSKLALCRKFLICFFSIFFDLKCCAAWRCFTLLFYYLKNWFNTRTNAQSVLRLQLLPCCVRLRKRVKLCSWHASLE